MSLIAVVSSKCDEVIESVEALGSSSEPKIEDEDLESEVEVDLSANEKPLPVDFEAEANDVLFQRGVIVEITVMEECIKVAMEQLTGLGSEMEIEVESTGEEDEGENEESEQEGEDSEVEVETWRWFEGDSNYLFE